MSDQTNREYYTLRMETERVLAATASHEGAARFHRELAELYAALLSDLDRPVRPTLRMADRSAQIHAGSGNDTP